MASLEPKLIDEADDVMQYLQSRKLTPEEACAAMGLAITCLIADKSTAKDFVRALQGQFKDRWAH